MTYMYQVSSAFVQWDHDIKSFCVTIVYLQTMKGFHVEDTALVITVAAVCMTVTACSGLLKK